MFSSSSKYYNIHYLYIKLYLNILFKPNKLSEGGKDKEWARRREIGITWKYIMSPTESCGLVPGKCHPPCRSQMLRVPWPYKAYMPPRLWPWPLHHAAKRTVPSSDVSWAQPTPSARGRGKGSGWFLGRPNRCLPLPLVYVSSSDDLFGLACHPSGETEASV